MLKTLSSGVTGVGSGCEPFDNSVVRVIYTLEGSNYPTTLPTASPNSPLGNGAASVEALVTSGRYAHTYRSALIIQSIIYIYIYL